MGLLIAAAVVAAAGAAAGAYEANKGQQGALSAEQQAWLNVKDISIKDQQRIVSQGDLDKYKAQFAAQQQVDPTGAALRTKGEAGVLSAINQDASGNTIAQQTLNQEKTLSDQQTPQENDVVNSLIARAKSDLAAGATLPPEFQAELVRSGLSGAAANGQSLNGEAGAGTNVRTLEGSAGIQLQAQRQNEAIQAASSAGDIQSRRASILSGLSVLDNNLRGAQLQRSAGAAGLGFSSVPNIGLSGAQVGDLSLANWKLDNTRTLAIGGINANKIISNATANTSYINAGTSAITGALGAYSGGAGGGSWIGGLLSSSRGGNGVGTSGNMPNTQY